MPRLKLTKTVVDSAQPDKDPYELRDAAIPGFLLKVTPTALTAEGDKPLGFEDGTYRSRTKLGNYRPFRHRRGPNRAVPPSTKRNANDATEAADAR
jgi:hypothetical protein